MFMRYRGGGIGHLYMREIKQWLNSSKWGSSWPSSLRDRDPSPDQEPPPQGSGNTATTSAQNTGYKSDSTEGDLGEDSNSAGSDRELTDEDGEGEDPEQSDDSDEDTEGDSDKEEGNISRTQTCLTGRVHRARRITQGIEENGIEESKEDFEGDTEDMEEDEDDIG